MSDKKIWSYKKGVKCIKDRLHKQFCSKEKKNSLFIFASIIKSVLVEFAIIKWIVKAIAHQKSHVIQSWKKSRGTLQHAHSDYIACIMNRTLNNPKKIKTALFYGYKKKDCIFKNQPFFWSSKTPDILTSENKGKYILV